MLIALSAGLLVLFLLWGFQDITAAPALQFNLGVARWIVVAVVAAAAATPSASRWIGAIMASLEATSPAARMRIAIAVGLLATVYLILTAHLQGRDLFAKTHDDQSYLLQMQMLARFRLWMPQHPLADFFDTFYVLNRPVYASLYFPGAAMLYVPTIWLGLPTWLLPACVAGGIVTLTFRIIAEVADVTSGLLAAMALVALEYFRVFSVLLTSHEPMLLLGLLMTWAWLRFRVRSAEAARTQDERPDFRETVSADTEPGVAVVETKPSGSSSDRRSRSRVRSAGWALAIGVFSGWAAITRPADAVCFAMPIGLVMLLDWLRPRTPENETELPAASGPSRVRSALVTSLLIVAGAAPFLILQAVFNRGVTGHWLETPYTHYLRQDQPNTSFGFHAFDPAQRPASTNVKKQDYYDQFFADYILRHQPGENLTWWGRVYLPMTVDTTLPTRLALPLVAVGLLVVLRDRRRVVVAGVIPFFLLVYYFNTFFLEHYALIIAPAVLLLAVLGIRRTAAAWPRHGLAIRSSLSAGLLAVSVLLLPEFNRFWPDRHQSGDETMTSSIMRMAKVELPPALDKPAIVLFAYRFGDSIVEEPVYNSETSWPDDAPVIYAHDLGNRNQELYRYYAERQPERQVYRFDRHAAEPLQDLGKVKDLVGK